MKKILVSLMLIAVVVGVLGTAFTAGISSWSGIGILSRGSTMLPTVGVDHVSYKIHSGVSDPASLVGVRLSFTADLSNPMIFISVRDSGNNELAYYAGSGLGTINESTTTLFTLYDTGNNLFPPVVNHPNVALVTDIIVTVADNGSTYTTAP